MRNKNSVIITGAAGEIGSAIAEKFYMNDVHTVGVDIKEPSSKYIDEFIFQDLTNTNLERLNDRIKSINSKTPIQYLINNAAIQIVKPMQDLTIKDMLDTYSCNLFSPIILANICKDYLKYVNGSIINIASVHAVATKNNFSIYASSKAALVSITRSMAIEFAPNVRVNCVSPAAIDTEMLRSGFVGNESAMNSLSNCHLLNRLGTAVEVAEVVYFLTSEKCGFVTGIEFSLDGGVTSRLLDPDNYMI